MSNKDLFSNKYVKHELKGKPRKALLKKKYQMEALKKAKSIARKIKKYPKVDSVYIGGSVVTGKLGKYERKWAIRNYSDIDLFILLKGRISDVTPTYKKLRKIGLTKEYFNYKGRFFVTFVSDNGKPLKFFGKFPVTAWLMSKYTWNKEISSFT